MHHNTESEQPAVNQPLYRNNDLQSQAQVLLKVILQLSHLLKSWIINNLNKDLQFSAFQQIKAWKNWTYFYLFHILTFDNSGKYCLLKCPLLKIIYNISIIFLIMFFLSKVLWKHEIESFNDKLLHTVNLIFLDLVNFLNWMSLSFCFDRQYNLQLSIKD